MTVVFALMVVQWSGWRAIAVCVWLQSLLPHEELKVNIIGRFDEDFNSGVQPLACKLVFTSFTSHQLRNAGLNCCCCKGEKKEAEEDSAAPDV